MLSVYDLNQKLYSAQKDKDTLRVSVLRFLLASMKNKEIELRPRGEEMTPEVVKKVIEKQIKQHKESIEMYIHGGRQDKADVETAELKVLEELLVEANNA